MTDTFIPDREELEEERAERTEQARRGSRPARAAQTPGGDDAAGARIVELEEKLAESRRLLAESETARRALQANANLPEGYQPVAVIEIETPHGKVAKAASKHLHWLAADLQAAIDRGDEPELTRAVLCRDGWLAPRDR